MSRSGALPVVMVALLSACGPADAERIDRMSAPSDSKPIVRELPAPHLPNVARRLTGCEVSKAPGSELWAEAVGDASVVEVSSVASDSQGGAIVSLASGETIAFDASGRRRWSLPFGALVAVGPGDDVYVAGVLDRPLTAGSTVLEPVGDTDVYVVRIGYGGVVNRTVRLGSVGTESVTSIAVGARGAVVSGSGLGTVALDGDGRTRWQASLHGHVAIDANGNVLVAGAFSRTLDFGGESLESLGGQDVFVAKLDADGNPLWAERFGDAGAEQRAQAVAVDRAGRVVVSGVFDGTIDFGGGPLIAPPATCPDGTSFCGGGFVVELEPDGGHSWSLARFPVRMLPGIVIDSRGDVIVSGALTGDDPPYHAPLLFALDASGNEIWSDVGSEPRTGAGHGVAIDRCDDVFWTLSTRPLSDGLDRAYLTKLSR